ncbi:hypothetical protein EZV61_15615 [Corallincola luteus]|uniref:Tetratricopeptide repeat protein n=1 Tax=Corallincola luteus TaxID=1775177 RepID=A0ABY2AHU7_9GAMM|nr:hypothetical protein [Corallincola luteus]TCI02004.1 hypothetical protein EZV61_15615 [Corallincola luteus]
MYCDEKHGPEWDKATALVADGKHHEALDVFQRLYDDDVQEALVEMGLIYEEVSEYTDSVYLQKAAECYRKVIEQYQDVHGYIGLGKLYYLGAGVEKTISKLLICLKMPVIRAA